MMNRKTITIIAALAAVALLIGGYFGAQAYIRANPRSPFNFSFDDWPESPRLTEFDSSKIDGIEVVSEGFALERIEGRWELVSGDTGGEDVRIEQSIISGRLWSISNIWAESLIEENPVDLAVYGLDNPRGHAVISDSDGNRAEFIFGNLTPTHTSTYVMMGGSPSVYTLSNWTSEMLLFTLDSIRDKNFLPLFDPRLVTSFVWEPRPGDNLPWEGPIHALPREPEDYLVTAFTSHTLHSPFQTRQGVDSERFGNMLQSLMEIQIVEFVDDNPSSLAPYGLDRPGRIIAESPIETFELLYGRSEFGLRYAMLAGNSSVFTLEGFEPVVSSTPFQLMDKFAYIFNIDHVDRFIITGDGRALEAIIEGTGDDAVFHLNGRWASDREFRQFYQTVIGLLIDAQFTGPPARGEGTDIVIEYWLNNPEGGRASLRLIPYNRDFYILEKDGNREFMIARTQVRRIFDSADNMVYLN